MEGTQPLMVRHFSHVDDPRRSKSVRHSLSDIFAIAFSAVISGIQSFSGMETFAESKSKWLKDYLGIDGPLPSHDTFRRVFSLIDPIQFEDAFILWMADVQTLTEGSVVAIDGKTLRGSRNPSRERRRFI